MSNVICVTIQKILVERLGSESSARNFIPVNEEVLAIEDEYSLIFLNPRANFILPYEYY